MIIAVRHGETALNENGKEKLRGWLPVPLTLDGMHQMIETAESLEDVENVKALYASDLVRTVQSAEEIAHVLVIEIEPREELRDWDYGEFTGKEVKGSLSALHALMDDPAKKAPNGEAFQDFLDRAVPFLRECIESKDLYILVTHNRVMTLLAALCATKGSHPDSGVMKKPGPVGPGGIMMIDPKWKMVYKSEKDPARTS